MHSDERDLDLDEVLIGGREKREIVIVDYDDTWPARFAVERARVQQALGACALRIQHFGSTAVPGLAAKPVIDILVTVEDPDDRDRSRADGGRLSAARTRARTPHVPDLST